MEKRNIPVQMISLCDQNGKLRPIRFRFDAGETGVRTVSIRKVVSAKEIQYVGIEALVYACQAVVDGREHNFELKYTVRTHRWELCGMPAEGGS